MCCVCQRLLSQTEQNILRLDVCMDDLTVCVQIVKTLKHLGIHSSKKAGCKVLTKILNALISVPSHDNKTQITTECTALLFI